MIWVPVAGLILALIGLAFGPNLVGRWRQAKTAKSVPQVRSPLDTLEEDHLRILATILEHNLCMDSGFQRHVDTCYPAEPKHDGGMGFLSAIHDLEALGFMVDSGGLVRVPITMREAVAARVAKWKAKRKP